MLNVCCLCQDDGGLGVVHHVPQETRRVGEFEHQEGSSCTQSRERRDDIVGTAVHENSNEAIPADPVMSSNIVGEDFALLVQLGVGQRPRLIFKGDEIRGQLGLSDEQGGQVFCGVYSRHVEG